MIHLWIQFVILFLLATKGQAEYCHGSPAPGERTNDNPIVDANMGEPVKKHKNGLLFMAGPPDHRFPVVHVWGTPYEMGFATAVLQKEYMRDFINQTFTYFIDQAANGWKSHIFSPKAEEEIIQLGIEGALDWNAEITKEFTPKEFFEEMRGLAEGSGISYQRILQLNLFPELTKASCSFMGAWDTATTNGKTFQLRALDWDTDGPFKDFPQVTVYHPTKGKAFANVGWPGQVGALTGMADGLMALSEIGISFPDDSFGQGTKDTPPEKVKGKPWMFVTRDVLQYSMSLEEAIEDMSEANRTCNLILGVGDGKNGLVNGFEYSGHVLTPYNDTHLLPVNASWHPKIPHVVYNGMDWLCPGFTGRLGEQLQKYHGSIDAKVMVRNVLPSVQTGNLHIAVYDLTDNKMHLSLARPSAHPKTEPLYAFQRTFTTFDMKALFATPRPL